MPENDITSKDSLSGGGDVNPSDGSGAASPSGNPDEIVGLKDLLKEATGKDFPSDEKALKSIKDTYDYVGQLGKEIKQLKDQLNPLGDSGKKEIDPNKFVSREEFDEVTFFAKNQELATYKDILKSIAVANNKSLEEAVNLDAFKTIYEKAKSYDEVEKSKSVLLTNPRLGQVRDKMTEAREKNKSGDTVSAGRLATQAVLEAYDLKNE